MKPVSSQMIKLFVLVVSCVVLLSQTLVLAKEFIKFELIENLEEENINLGIELKERFVMPTADNVDNKIFILQACGYAS